MKNTQSISTLGLALAMAVLPVAAQASARVGALSQFLKVTSACVSPDSDVVACPVVKVHRVRAGQSLLKKAEQIARKNNYQVTEVHPKQAYVEIVSRLDAQVDDYIHLRDDGRDLIDPVADVSLAVYKYLTRVSGPHLLDANTYWAL